MNDDVDPDALRTSMRGHAPELSAWVVDEVSGEDLLPYLRALNEQASDLMADRGIPQEFWPAQVVKPRRPVIDAGTESAGG